MRNPRRKLNLYEFADFRTCAIDAGSHSVPKYSSLLIPADAWLTVSTFVTSRPTSKGLLVDVGVKMVRFTKVAVQCASLYDNFAVLTLEQSDNNNKS